MDILRTHSAVVQDYESYIKSFLNIADEANRFEERRGFCRATTTTSNFGESQQGRRCP